jgi:hypothetical protein
MRITRRKDKTIKRIKLANLGSMVAPNIHNFDPKWVKRGWPPRKSPQNGLYVFCKHKNKTLFPHIARRISEAAIGMAGRGQGTSYFTSVFQWNEKAHDADGPSTSSIVFNLFLGIE